MRCPDVAASGKGTGQTESPSEEFGDMWCVGRSRASPAKPKPMEVGSEEGDTPVGVNRKAC